MNATHIPRSAAHRRRRESGEARAAAVSPSAVSPSATVESGFASEDAALAAHYCYVVDHSASMKTRDCRGAPACARLLLLRSGGGEGIETSLSPSSRK